MRYVIVVVVVIRKNLQHNVPNVSYVFYLNTEHIAMVRNVNPTHIIKYTGPNIVKHVIMVYAIIVRLMNLCIVKMCKISHTFWTILQVVFIDTILHSQSTWIVINRLYDTETIILFD